MKRAILLLFVLPLFSNLSAQSYAGGEISVINLGNDNYEIWVTYVKNCVSCNDTTGCDLPAKVVLTHTKGKKELTLQKMSRTPEPKPRCVDCTICTDPGCAYEFGYSTYKLKASVNLENERKNGICGVLATVNMNGVDSTIKNMDLSKDLFLSNEFSICVQNNTPKAQSLSVNACLGRDKVINLSSYGVDTNSNGKPIDKMSYSMAPIMSTSDTLNYTSPYDYENPFYYLGFPKRTLQFPRGLHFDSQNADLFFRPMKVENTIIRIKIEERRNGKLLSTSYKDVRINTTKCPSNNPPIISGINCTDPKSENFKAEAIEGDTICFNICTTDKEKDDSTTISWNNGIKGASFTAINPGSRRETAKFCWVPTSNDVSKLPHAFVVTSKDNSCSEGNLSARTFLITVKRKVGFSYQITELGCGSVRIIAKETNEIGVAQWMYGHGKRVIAKKGQAIDTTVLEHLNAGWNKFTITAIGSNGSTRVVEDSVFSSGAVLNQSEVVTSSCTGDTILVDIGAAVSAGTTIRWIQDGDSRLIKNLGAHTTDKTYFVKAGNGICTDTLLVTVDVAEIKASFIAIPKSGDAPLEVEFQNTSGKDADSFYWSFGDTVGVGFHYENPIATYRNKGLFDVTLKTFKIGSPCSDSITYLDYINVFPTGLTNMPGMEISLFPNPANEVLTISNPAKTKATLQLINIQGKVISTTLIDKEKQEIDVSSLTSGIFLARITSDNEVSETSLVIY